MDLWLLGKSSAYMKYGAHSDSLWWQGPKYRMKIQVSLNQQAGLGREKDSIGLLASFSLGIRSGLSRGMVKGKDCHSFP